MPDLLLLGPIAVRLEGATCVPSTQKLAALLAWLALGGPQPRARVAAWLWPQLLESAARRNLRRELARLRDAGLGDLVVADGDELSLSAGVKLDTQQAGAAAAAGQPQEALALWRGPLADGLELSAADDWAEWLHAQRQALHGQWRQWLDDATQACLRAGDSAGALQHLSRLIADDPLQEHHHRELIRLHAAAGQFEAAQAQYQRCRELLTTELGLAPSAETQALAAQLAGARAPPNPIATPAATEAGGAPETLDMPLVGRDTEWAALQRAWSAGRPIVIEGEAGIGKSRLARDFAAAQGAYALAQCRRSDAGVPYASFTRVLRCLAGQKLANLELPEWVQLELRHVLPELGRAPQRISSAEEQRRFSLACASAWQELAAGSFDAVLIDDWHWADNASRRLLGFIVDQALPPEPQAVRLLLAQRPELPAAARAAQQALMETLEAQQAMHLRLAPLGGPHVYEMVRRLSGASAPRRFARRLEQACGGNPFFIGETLRQWRAQHLLQADADGVWQTPFDDDTETYAELPLPDSVRDAVLARVRQQGDAVQRLLEAAALAAEPFTPALMAGACALTEVEALHAIEAAVAVQLLREREPGFAFAHDLVQAALESALAPERRRLVHRRLALGGEAAGLPAADIARHWEAGAQPERAVPHRMKAAEQALALFADQDAEAHWQAALSDQPTLAQTVRILGQRAQVLLRRADQPGLEATVAALDAAAAQALKQPGLEAAALALEAAVHAADVLVQGQHNEQALQRVQRCLADPRLESRQRAQALRVQSLALSRLGRTDEARAATEAALAAGSLSPWQRGELLHALSYTHFLRGDALASLDHAQRALQLWQGAGARHHAAQAQASIGRALDMLDEREPAWAALELAYAQASELRMIELQRVVANNLANNRLHHGGPSRALEVIAQARALSPHFIRSATPVFYLGIETQAHAQLGQLEAALDTSAKAFEMALTLGDALTLADCLTMTLDLHSALVDRPGTTRLLVALAERPPQGLRYFEIKLGLVLAAHALREGRLADARQHLLAVGEPEQLPQPGDRACAQLRHAQLALAQGRAAEALAWLAPLAGQPLYTEIEAQSCATRLQAEALLGPPSSDALALADAALSVPAGHRVLPALSLLELRDARHAAAVAGSDGPLAQRLTAEMEAQRRQLTASLGCYAALAPALQPKDGPVVRG